MYVCDCHSLKLSGGRIARKGDLVPEALLWPENIRRANISLGFIKLVPDEESPVPTQPVAVKIEPSPENSNKKFKKRR
jgi:hypothetical protein